MASKLTITMFFACFSVQLTATELPEFYVPVRPAGMGGAFTAIANDHNSIWTNPAGIGRIRKARSRQGIHLFAIPTLMFGANAEGQSFLSDVQAASSNQSSSQEQNIRTALEKSQGASKPLWGRLVIGSSLFFEYSKGTPAVIGLYSNTRAKLVIDPDADAATQVETISDQGAVLGVGFTNRTNRFNVGLQIRPMTRYAFDDRVEVSLLADQTALQEKIQSDSNNGSGVGVDLGMIWTFADFWFPTFGIAMLNVPTGCRDEYLNPFAQVRQRVCGTTFTGTINNPEALSLVDPTDLRVGVSITPRLSRKLALRIGLDAHHLYFTDGQSYYGLSGAEGLKQFHGGLEIFIGNPLLLNPFSVRVGYGEGFASYGLTMRFGFLALEVASYGRDISSTTSPQEDRRILASLTGEF